ncbi:unnamed protein product [Peniophora sp. CBMAI 1063]|nr:unnamed protein product [Peniophora sp. CBMAI 1063]
MSAFPPRVPAPHKVPVPVKTFSGDVASFNMTVGKKTEVPVENINYARPASWPTLAATAAEKAMEEARIAHLEVSKRPQNTMVSRTAPFQTTIPFNREDVTIETILNVVKDNKLSYYLFHPEISGCLWWQLTLVEKLEAMGLLEKGSRDMVVDKISKQHASGGPLADVLVSRAKSKKKPFEPVEGVFYKLT